MLCPSCQSEVEPTKFCSNCGALLAKNEIKQRPDVSLEWVREIYDSLGYETADIQKDEGNSRSFFFAKHSKNPNLTVEFRSSLRVLLITSAWTIKPPSLMERGEFFRALNSMSLDTVSCQCSVSEKDMTSLYLQMTFFITDTVSRLDLIAFNEFATSLMLRVINQPRVQKIMT